MLGAQCRSFACTLQLADAIAIATASSSLAALV